MCRIPGTWHDSSTVNITVEEFRQHRKKKKSCPWLLNNRASDCSRIVPATVQESCQWLWTIVPVTVEELCQWLLKNRASHYWIIMPVTVEQSCQWLLKNPGRYCWGIVPVTVKQSCQWLLNNRASDCRRIVSATEQSYQRLLNGWVSSFSLSF